MNKFIACLLIYTLSSFSFAGKADWVISEISKGQADGSKEKYFLYPSEIVTLKKISGDKALVQRVNDQPSWETSDEEGNARARQPVWISKNNIVNAGAFEKITAWNGENVWGWCTGSCDAATSFSAKSDGSFFAEYSTAGGGPGENNSHKYKGHLYRYKRLIWARPMNESKFTDVSVFYETSSRQLKNYVELFGNI